MVQIIEHRDFIPEDFLMEEEAASSMPQSSNRLAIGAAAMHAAQQHTHVQTSRASRAAPGALSAAKELLCNPPSSTASPGAMRQWREDVDRLLGMAHSGMAHFGLARPRPRSFRCQREASAPVHSPSVRGAQTNDLRAELNPLALRMTGTPTMCSSSIRRSMDLSKPQEHGMNALEIS
jgi:hypothetical protein